MKFIVALLTTCLIHTIRANVLGIDFGTKYIKATLVVPGKPFTIVEALDSNRKTQASVTFTEKERMFGSNSHLQSGRHPEATFDNLLDYVGMKFDEEHMIQIAGERFFFGKSIPDDRGQVGWLLKKGKGDDAEEEIFYTETLLAMILKDLKKLAEQQGGTVIHDAVITVPQFFD